MIRILAIVGILAGLALLLAGQDGLVAWAVLAAGVLAAGVLVMRGRLDRDDAQPEAGRAFEAGDPLPAHARRGDAAQEATSREVTSIGGRDGRAGGYIGGHSGSAGSDGGGS